MLLIIKRGKWLKSGRGREIRTPDILLPKQARYQTALYPDVIILALAPALFSRGSIILIHIVGVNGKIQHSLSLAPVPCDNAEGTLAGSDLNMLAAVNNAGRICTARLV